MTVKPTLAYLHSIEMQPGVTGSPNVFMSLFNPAGSNALFTVPAAFISSVALNSTTATNPMRGFRISAASGGSEVAAADIAKLNTRHPDPLAEVRVSNPTVTLGPALFNSPPLITTGTGGSGVHAVELPPGSPPLILFPGEGIAIRTANGDTDQLWNITLAWSERR